MLHVWMQFIERTAHMNLKRTVSADEFFSGPTDCFLGKCLCKDGYCAGAGPSSKIRRVRARVTNVFHHGFGSFRMGYKS